MNHYIEASIRSEFHQRGTSADIVGDFFQRVEKDGLILVNGGSRVRIALLSPLLKTLIHFQNTISIKGYGELQQSKKTPRGYHTIDDMIGDGLDKYTSFIHRKPDKIVTPTKPPEVIGGVISRIITISGQEQSFNESTKDRGIYIHGTRNHWKLDKGEINITYGCMGMYPQDIITLFNKVKKGMAVYISDRNILNI